MKFYLHNLGCDKNRVDGETLSAQLAGAGWKMVDKPEGANLVIVNTCGFIGPAKEESLEAVFGFSRSTKTVIVGCLSSRYENELRKDLKEADAVFGLAHKPETAQKILSRYSGPCKRFASVIPRLLSSPAHSAPIKIAEGCDNRCAYCAIPLIRGSRISRPEKEVLEEARFLRGKGVKELIVVAQDTTAYNGGKGGLPVLLQKLCGIGFEWIRPMYCHPCGVDDALIGVLADEPAIVKYIDLPLQHISDPLLKRMNRHYTRAKACRVIERLRQRIPGIALRTTFLVGFPGETEKDFNELCKYVKETEFERLGAFAWSAEEGTAAFRMGKRVPERVKQERLEELLYLASDILFRKNRERIGETVRVLIDETVDNVSLGRTPQDAPEVDCSVVVKSRKVQPGKFYTLKIRDAEAYDLFA
ncbi:MAG: 30S ribosomal protein S12 methylthiotransferase RimO [Fibrobacterota bacterium]